MTSALCRAGMGASHGTLQSASALEKKTVVRVQHSTVSRLFVAAPETLVTLVALGESQSHRNTLL